MATVSMNAIQFYDPSSAVPSLSARCAAALQKHSQSTGSVHRKEWSRMLQSYNQSQNTGKEIAGNQHDHASDDSIAADEDDEFPLIDEVIRRALHSEDSTEKPTNSALAVRLTDKTSFVGTSGSSMPAQSSLPGHLGGSKGTNIDSALLQTKQLLIDAQSSQSYLMTTMMTTMMMTMMMITTMPILIARAAEASPAIRTLTIPAENLVYLLLQQLPIPVRCPLTILLCILLQLRITIH